MQAPQQQYKSVQYVEPPHATTIQAPALHYPIAPTHAAPIPTYAAPKPTYAAPMALPAPLLQQYVPAPQVQFIARYVPAPMQQELPRLSRTITLDNPENPYYNAYGMERYNRLETHNNIAADYEYMTVWLY